MELKNTCIGCSPSLLIVFFLLLLLSIFLSYLLLAWKKRSAELISLFLLQIKELEAGGTKPQDSKIDTGLGAKRKVLINYKLKTCFGKLV